MPEDFRGKLNDARKRNLRKKESIVKSHLY